MSVYSNLLGLYPTSQNKLVEILSELRGDEKWPKYLPWQPIPVHTVTQIDDHVRSISRKCSIYKIFIRGLLVDKFILYISVH